jgi:dephospho-CoA kinase
VVIDGLYSWEEYLCLKNHYGEDFYLVAVVSAPQKRYERLKDRTRRGLTWEEAASRDKAEIENLNKGGPIAMADYTIINEFSIENLQEEVERIVMELK